MKQLYVWGLSFFLLTEGRSMAQAPDAAGTLSDTVAHAAQASGVAGSLPVSGMGQAGEPYFYAYRANDDDEAMHRVILHWQLQSEFNADHFILERASDLYPAHFDPRHELVATGDSAGQAYTDQDDAPAGATSFYRLKIVLRNGDAFYSPVVAVDMRDKRSLALRPSVLTTGGTLHLNTNTDYRQPMTINFFDVGGRMTATYLVNSSYFDINTAGWSKGIYIYRITDGRHPLIDSGKILIL